MAAVRVALLNDYEIVLRGLEASLAKYTDSVDVVGGPFRAPSPHNALSSLDWNPLRKVQATAWDRLRTPIFWYAVRMYVFTVLMLR